MIWQQTRQEDDQDGIPQSIPHLSFNMATRLLAFAATSYFYSRKSCWRRRWAAQLPQPTSSRVWEPHQLRDSTNGELNADLDVCIPNTKCRQIPMPSANMLMLGLRRRIACSSTDEPSCRQGCNVCEYPSRHFLHTPTTSYSGYALQCGGGGLLWT